MKEYNNYLIELNSEDGYALDGYIHKPNEENNKKVLIAIHGMTSNCFKKKDKIIANEMEKLNIDTICFNNRGSEIIKRVKDKYLISVALVNDSAVQSNKKTHQSNIPLIMCFHTSPRNIE